MHTENQGELVGSPIERMLIEIQLIYKLGKWVLGTFLIIGVTGIGTLIQGNVKLDALQKWQERTIPILEQIPLLSRDVNEFRKNLESMSPRVDSMWWTRTNRF